MANVWDEFDKAYDLDGLNKDLKDNENNSGNYREVPHGTYEVAVNKMELAKSKKGKPMVSIWFKIAAGEFAGSLIFYNQVIDNSFGIHSNNDLLRSMDLDCVNNLGEHDHDVFQSFGQYGRRPEGANLATARNISDYIRLSPPPPAGGAPSQRGPGLQQHPEIRIGHGEGAA